MGNMTDLRTKRVTGELNRLNTKKVYHPNVYITNGEICVDILGDKWDKIVQVAHLFHSLLFLVEHPNPDDAANGQAAKFWKTDKKAYEKEVLKMIQKEGNVNENFRSQFENKLVEHGLTTEKAGESPQKKAKLDLNQDNQNSLNPTENSQNSQNDVSNTTDNYEGDAQLNIAIQQSLITGDEDAELQRVLALSQIEQ